jgi:phosphopantothenoylcysteine decarboxylase/phosphopantothenate--cysteine ligase
LLIPYLNSQNVSIRCLITAGPTREFLDPVRFLSNPSTGKMGFAIAAAAVEFGWTVDLVAGPVALPEPKGALLYPVVTAEEMYRQVEALFGPADVFIATAAVSDWRPKKRLAQKLKRDTGGLTMELETCPDILAGMAAQKRDNQLLVGFAAETEKVEEHARRKLESKGIDWIAANSVAGLGGAFGSETNTLILLGRDGTREVIGPALKLDVARKLIQSLAQRISAR